MFWTVAWTLWIIVGAALELVALSNKIKDDTLSEKVWTILSDPTWGKFTAWMLVAFLAWLIVHFASKGRFA